MLSIDTLRHRSPSTSRRVGSRGVGVRGGLLLAALLAPAASCSSEDPGDGVDLNAGSGLEGPIFDDGSSSEGNVPGYFDGQTCATQTAGAELLPSVMQLLVDTSGSMNDDAPGERGSKWTVTRRAVLQAVNAMPAESAVGLIFYPNVPNNQRPCIALQTAVGIAPLGDAGTAQRRGIQRAFQRQGPLGGTPTHDAYQYALSQVGETAAIGPRFVVLITDGIPTYSLGCEGTGQAEDAVDPSPLIDEAAAASSRGVRTFVIGSPGSEGARASLSRMAEAGGTALDNCSHTGPNYCHFDMTSQDDLGAGLESVLGIISGVALGCRYAVPQSGDGALLDASKVNILFTPPGGAQELIGQSLDPACSEGWQYAEDQTQIRLCGSTCDRVQELEGSLTLQFGCATELR
jgi:hypothetical protein